VNYGHFPAPDRYLPISQDLIALCSRRTIDALVLAAYRFRLNLSQDVNEPIKITEVELSRMCGGTRKTIAAAQQRLVKLGLLRPMGPSSSCGTVRSFQVPAPSAPVPVKRKVGKSTHLQPEPQMGNPTHPRCVDLPIAYKERKEVNLKKKSISSSNAGARAAAAEVVPALSSQEGRRAKPVEIDRALVRENPGDNEERSPLPPSAGQNRSARAADIERIRTFMKTLPIPDLAGPALAERVLGWAGGDADAAISFMSEKVVGRKFNTHGIWEGLFRHDFADWKPKPVHTCPKCGPGVPLGQYSDTCGRCGRYLVKPSATNLQRRPNPSIYDPSGEAEQAEWREFMARLESLGLSDIPIADDRWIDQWDLFQKEKRAAVECDAAPGELERKTPADCIEPIAEDEQADPLRAELYADIRRIQAIDAPDRSQKIQELSERFEIDRKAADYVVQPAGADQPAGVGVFIDGRPVDEYPDGIEPWLEAHHHLRASAA
jgi:hypothetical protein